MYEKGKVAWGEVTDTKTENYDTVTGAFLPHSCDKWVIGDRQRIEWLIEDLQALLSKGDK